MKRPNFRLYGTQATASVYLGVFGLLLIAMLTVFVFKGFNFEHRVVPYNAKEGLSRFRPYLVYAATAMSLVTGFVAGTLGFSSLGQKRNQKQGRSWLGMLTGAMVISLAPILFIIWQSFSEALILAGN